MSSMIRSFRSRALQQFAATGDPSKLKVENAGRIRRILIALNEAKTPQALAVPGFRFHALKGKMKGRYAVNASGNYRITFSWSGEDAINVDLEDYH
jgi:proteic killer suppression protein